MAYSELVKNFNKVRSYMRDFYVYGFKRRDEFTGKSGRSYDNERRRLESWLGDYMRFRHTPDGKNVFLSIDSRVSRHNPLYKAWKTKSFTDGDITLHFLIFDILSDPETGKTSRQILEEIDAALLQFSHPKVFDESTIRKKLKEYTAEGLLVTKKTGKAVYYYRAESFPAIDANLLDYFSEVLPCGVIGSYLLDQCDSHEEHFAFKHHYITGAMDSEVLYGIFCAIRKHCSMAMIMMQHSAQKGTERQVVPLKVMISVQSGRQYLLAYDSDSQKIVSIRLDSIAEVRMEERCDRFEELQKQFGELLPHMWGVSLPPDGCDHLEHVEFTVRFGTQEQHIRNRLEREKRCGTVEHLDSHTSRFSADVYDAEEMVPWIRTFICRITEIHFSNAELEKKFKDDLNEMYRLYGIEESYAFQ